MKKRWHKLRKPKSFIVDYSRALLWDVSAIISLAQSFGIRYGVIGIAVVFVYEVGAQIVAGLVTVAEDIE